MRRKAYFFIAVVLTVLFLCSCAKEQSVSPEPSGSPEPASPSVPADSASPSQTPSESPDPEGPAEEAGAALVEDDVFEKDYELEVDDGRIFRGELYISVPEISSEEYPDNAGKINEHYQGRKDNFREGFEAELEEFAGYEMSGWGMLPISLDVSYKTEYNRDGIISFSFAISSYTGGAHDMITIDSETFDLREGTRICADDLFTVGEEVYAPRIKEKILGQMDEQAESGDAPYYENYAELVEETFNKESFILTEKGLCYYFQIYDIAPYAGGSFRFTIPYEELSDILDPKYGFAADHR
jgi:hypothetical protein